MFLKPTASVPSTVQALSVPDVGVPRTGVTSVGTPAELIVIPVLPAPCNTKEPEASPVIIAPPVTLSALSIVAMSYSSAWIFAVKAASSAMSCSLVGAGGGVGLACSAAHAASIASHSASSSAVNKIGPSAVMWCLDMMCPYELAMP